MANSPIFHVFYLTVLLQVMAPSSSAQATGVTTGQSEVFTILPFPEPVAASSNSLEAGTSRDSLPQPQSPTRITSTGDAASISSGVGPEHVPDPLKTVASQDQRTIGLFILIPTFDPDPPALMPPRPPQSLPPIPISSRRLGNVAPDPSQTADPDAGSPDVNIPTSDGGSPSQTLKGLDPDPASPLTTAFIKPAPEARPTGVPISVMPPSITNGVPLSAKPPSAPNDSPATIQTQQGLPLGKGNSAQTGLAEGDLRATAAKITPDQAVPSDPVSLDIPSIAREPGNVASQNIAGSTLATVGTERPGSTASSPTPTISADEESEITGSASMVRAGEFWGLLGLAVALL